MSFHTGAGMRVGASVEVDESCLWCFPLTGSSCSGVPKSKNPSAVVLEVGGNCGVALDLVSALGRLFWIFNGVSIACRRLECIEEDIPHIPSWRLPFGLTESLPLFVDLSGVKGS